MFDFVNFPEFLTTSLLLIITPGVGFVFTVTKGILTNRVEAFKVGLGICALLLLDTLISAVGVSYIISSSKFLSNGLILVGVAYLIYLSVQTFKNLNKEIKEKRFKKYNKSFIQGFIIAISDPQAIAFFVIVIPHFIDKNTEHHVWNAFLLGVIFTLISFVWLSIVAYLVGSLGKSAMKNKKFHFVTKLMSGLVYLGLALHIFITNYKTIF
ncbi:LysE family translocator [Aureivirga sp. CE67]|uniref:LysE family translocator n=1 Tax=Aureivirga sp. CE67 TaxID=1788983 RepID=UPI0018C93BC0|nr:LysE family translocator [Aureivirga sp. CE67]